MNLPNKLTLLRVFMIPFFIYFLLGDPWPGVSKWIALALFIIASITDWLDGFLARKYKLVTNFGKFMDPLADKLLVCSALVCFVETNELPAWMVVIIISREFIISGFRLVASDNGVVIAASYFGKFKTVAQILMICLIIADLDNQVFVLAKTGLIWISLILTLVSLGDYLIKNRSVMSSH